METVENIEVLISGDKMEADVYIPCVEGRPPVTIGQLKQALAKHGVVAGLIEDAKIEARLEATTTDDVQFTVAYGKAPGHGQDATIAYDFGPQKQEPASPEKKGNVDHREYAGGEVISVSGGQVIAWKVPATRGDEGFTVSGETTPGEWGMDVTIKAGDNVLADGGNAEFTAQIDGSPVLVNNVLRIDPIHVVNGDVDYKTGNIRFGGALRIKGNVSDGFIIDAGGNILVEGTITAAVVSAGGDIEVRGGIITRESGSIKAGGAVKARFIENSLVEAEGDITVERAIMNSRVFSNKNISVLAREGAVIGGETSAWGEISAKILGSSTEARTMLRAGFRFDTFNEIADLEKAIGMMTKKIEQLKKSIAILSAQNSEPEKLGAAKMAAIELEKQRRDVQIRINGLKKKQAPNTNARIRGEQIINEGCSVVIGSAALRITHPLKYATLYESRDGRLGVTAYDEKTGQITTQNVSDKAAKYRVLVVDDAKFMRVKLRDILESDGFNVVGEAEDGLQAVDKARQLKPDVITMDITMPNMDGISAVQEIKKNNPGQLVVMISALGQADKVRAAIISGAADFIVKPFDPDKVKSIVKQVLALAKK